MSSPTKEEILQRMKEDAVTEMLNGTGNTSPANYLAKSQAAQQWLSGSSLSAQQLKEMWEKANQGHNHNNPINNMIGLGAFTASQKNNLTPHYSPTHLGVMCEECAEKERKTISGRAISVYECFVCLGQFSWPNTAKPKLCHQCSMKNVQCMYCGKLLGNQKSKKPEKFSFDWL